jgi:hypothetical protein
MTLTHPVYKIQYHLSLQDPSFTYTRYHTVLFIETDPDGGGRNHHVTGDLASGMSYQSRVDRPLEQDETFHAREYLGRVHAADYPASVEKILAGLEPPGKQRVFSAAKMVYVRCEADRTVYEDDEEVPELAKCTEWTEGRVIPAMIQAGLILPGTEQERWSEGIPSPQY